MADVRDDDIEIAKTLVEALQAEIGALDAMLEKPQGERGRAFLQTRRADLAGDLDAARAQVSTFELLSEKSLSVPASPFETAGTSMDEDIRTEQNMSPFAKTPDDTEAPETLELIVEPATVSSADSQRIVLVARSTEGTLITEDTLIRGSPVLFQVRTGSPEMVALAVVLSAATEPVRVGDLPQATSLSIEVVMRSLRRLLELRLADVAG